MKQMNWMKRIWYLLVFSVVPLSVSAQVSAGSENFLNAFSFMGQFLEAIFQSEYAVYGLVIISFALLFYNLFVPLIGKIPVFKGDGKNAANKYGRVVSLSLSLLSVLSIFGLLYINGGVSSPRDFLNNILGPYATFAGILLSLLVFSIIYYGFKDLENSTAWKRGLWGAAASLVLMGGLLARPFLFSLGWLIVFILLIATFASFFFAGGPFGSGSGSGGRSGGSGSGAGGAGGAGKEFTVVLEGKVLDETGKPVSGLDLKTIDDTGTEITGATAKSRGSGKFRIRIKSTSEIILGDIFGEKSNVTYTATKGRDKHGGTDIETIKINKNKTIKDIIVAGEKGVSKFEIEEIIFDAAGRVIQVKYKRV